MSACGPSAARQPGPRSAISRRIHEPGVARRSRRSAAYSPNATRTGLNVSMCVVSPYGLGVDGVFGDNADTAIEARG
jgi:hypothetical protein